MVLQVVYELCPVGWVLGDLLAQIVQSHVGGKEFGGREVTLAVLDVFPVVLSQTLPCGGVQDEGWRLEHNGDADVQMPVGHVIVQHAGSLLTADSAPEQTGGVDAHAKDQRGRDETWSMRGLCRDSRSKGQKAYQFEFRLPVYRQRQSTEVDFSKGDIYSTESNCRGAENMSWTWLMMMMMQTLEWDTECYTMQIKTEEQVL